MSGTEPGFRDSTMGQKGKQAVVPVFMEFGGSDEKDNHTVTQANVSWNWGKCMMSLPNLEVTAKLQLRCEG